MNKCLAPFIASALILSAIPAIAKTEATLQVARPGFEGFDRHHIALTDKMSDGRDVLLLMSCKLNDPTNYGAVIDFGVGSIWDIEGEAVTIETDSHKVELPMNSDGEFLVMGGVPAVKAFLPLLAARKASFTANGVVATFDLTAVHNHISRFKALCHPNAE
ncbi:hypothetical protein [Agrobacterium fabrum]|uniref:hypothetical protein n=1 Tax=Agrobacterium fabrum TaxID=1176649 RepID=UPI003BA085AE